MAWTQQNLGNMDSPVLPIPRLFSGTGLQDPQTARRASRRADATAAVKCQALIIFEAIADQQSVALPLAPGHRRLNTAEVAGLPVEFQR